MHRILLILTMLFAFFAAVLWFISARVRLMDWDAGPGFRLDIDELGKRLNRQHKLSAAAAICAGISGLCEAIRTCDE